MSVATPPLSYAAPATPSVATRLESLDIFRGLTIAAMILVNNPGKGVAYGPLEHAEWHGWTPTDLIFPFFLFIVGVATPFSLAKRGSAAVSKVALLGHIWSRALALFMLGQLLSAFPYITDGVAVSGFTVLTVLRAIGVALVYGGIVALLVPWPWKRVSNWLPVVIAVLFYLLAIAMHFAVASAKANGWPAGESFGRGIFNPDFVRIPGVLQRIGVCYGVAASLALFAGRRTMIAAIVVLCGAYLGLMFGIRTPDGSRGSLTATTNVARYVDESVFDRWTTNADGQRVYTQQHNYRAYPDPEGIVSTLPAIATTALGVLVGWRLRRVDLSPAEACGGLLAMAVPVTIVGWWLDVAVIPVNKQLWTPSFVFLTGGLAMLGLGCIYWLADVRKRRAWAFPLKVFGMNAIAAFVLSGVIVRVCRMILVRDPATGRDVAAHTWVDNRVSEWMTQTLQPAMPSWLHLATPQNTSLAYALLFVLLMFAILLLMYVCRVFVKV